MKPVEVGLTQKVSGLWKSDRAVDHQIQKIRKWCFAVAKTHFS